jgi:hypothetical protein
VSSPKSASASDAFLLNCPCIATANFGIRPLTFHRLAQMREADESRPDKLQDGSGKMHDAKPTRLSPRTRARATSWQGKKRKFIAELRLSVEFGLTFFPRSVTKCS